MFEIRDTKLGYSMKIKGLKINRPEVQNIATDLGVAFRDVVFNNGILTVYDTSKKCQKIISEKSLYMFVAMALDIPLEDVTPIKI